LASYNNLTQKAAVLAFPPRPKVRRVDTAIARSAVHRF